MGVTKGEEMSDWTDEICNYEERNFEDLVDSFIEKFGFSQSNFRIRNYFLFGSL